MRAPHTGAQLAAAVLTGLPATAWPHAFDDRYDLLALTVRAGLIGTGDSMMNLAPTMTWIIV